MSSVPETFDDLRALTDPAVLPILDGLRALILAFDPNAVETVRLGDRAATYGLGPRKMIDGYAYILPYSKWVNLGFYQGAALPDANGLLQGTGKRLRHVKIRDTAQITEPVIKAFLIAAKAERIAALR
ncbi:MAG: DUF1801 domain-containing protein [Shimia sp.]|uniref:DUF1801 domain-containing protein n=1 Tax=Shimia sp. TaxID=1954381 RepID=UPI00405A2B9B